VHDYDGKARIPRDADDKEIIRTTTTLGPVVDLDLFRRANEVLDERAAKNERAPRNVAGRNHAPRVLTGLVYCGRCGAKMAQHKDSGKLSNEQRKSTWRWLCTGPTRRQQGRQHPPGQPERPYCAAGHSIGEGRLLDMLRGIGKDVDTTEYVIVTAAAPVPDLQERTRAQETIRKAQEAIERIRDAYDAGVYDLGEMTRRVDAQEAIVAQAEATLNALETAQQERVAPMPTTRRVDVTNALEELLADALCEEETLEDTMEVRDALNRRLAAFLARVEIDSPRVRVCVRAAP
jgi:hypothetical protein